VLVPGITAGIIHGTTAGIREAVVMNLAVVQIEISSAPAEAGISHAQV
jgi:hypothetical protein